jgi:DNA polymerase-3 subunit beta
MFHKELASLIPLIVEKKATIPVLTCVLVNAKEKTIMGTDLDMFAILRNAPITGKDSIVVDAYTLQGIAKGTKKEFAMAITKDGLQVISDGDTYTLESQTEVENFPVAVYGNAETTAKDMPLSLFKVSVCSSTEETRYYLNGVNLNAAGQTMHAVATDGHRLALRNADITINGDGFAKKKNIIVPNKAVKAIQKLFTDKIDMSLTDKQRFTIEQGNIQLVSKLIDGNFPDYERVIPQEKNATSIIEVDGKEMARLCGKITVVDGHQAHLFGGADGYWLRLKGKKSTVEKKLSDIKVNKFEVGFNAGYMEDLIDNMENKSFSMRMIDPSSPIRITNDNNLYVLMPMRIA